MLEDRERVNLRSPQRVIEFGLTGSTFGWLRRAFRAFYTAVLDGKCIRGSLYDPSSSTSHGGGATAREPVLATDRSTGGRVRAGC